MKRPPLRSFRVENFKAIRDSGKVEFGWLTAFIGNNGVGKSSLVEGLEAFRDVVLFGLNFAFRPWRGFEHVWNKARARTLVQDRNHRCGYSHPMRFHLECRVPGTLKAQQAITQGPGGNAVFIEEEQLVMRRPGSTEHWTRDEEGEVFLQGPAVASSVADHFRKRPLGDGESMLSQFIWDSVQPWQFLMLNPDRLGQPTALQTGTRNSSNLEKDGANIGQYLNEIRELDLSAFEGLLEALRTVLPYAIDLQPNLTSELERAFYLKLKEQTFEIPGWLLSTGTLRIVALLACLRHPKPPPLLVVEEIENGLDPRTMALLVEEIRAAITLKTTQVILTTYSPYLLDLLDLSHIVVVERAENEPVFRRPDAKKLGDWAKSFSPGRLYTMGRLTEEDQ